MCERCDKLDARIERYLRLSRGVNDKRTVERLATVIADLDSEKSALHPPPEK